MYFSAALLPLQGGSEEFGKKYDYYTLKKGTLTRSD